MITTESYIFFYGSIYSQWYPITFKVTEREYNCAEQFMMYQKAILFDDFEIANKIIQTAHPFGQKILGKKVKNFDKEKWESVCRDIVYRGNLAKFTQNAELKTQILGTGDRKFVECSPNDCLYGIGLSEEDERIYDPTKWLGTNWLGQALDKVKENLKQKIWE